MMRGPGHVMHYAFLMMLIGAGGSAAAAAPGRVVNHDPLSAFVEAGGGAAAEVILTDLPTSLVPSPAQFAVLLPPGYDPGAQRRYPLLLLLHGGGGDRSFLSERMKPLLEQAWAQGILQPAVVVTPSAGRSFYMDHHDGSQRWETFIMGELLPHLRATYHVSANPAETLVAGISMGGMGALRMALKQPGAFAAVAALEPGIEPVLAFDDIELQDRFWRSDDLFEEIFGRPVDRDYWQKNNPANIALANADRIRASGLRIYLEVGDEDSFNLHRGTEFLHRLLVDNQIRHGYRYLDGADHTGLTIPTRFLYAFAHLNQALVPPPADPTLLDLHRRIDLMKRRAGLAADAPPSPAAAPDYAESVALYGMTPDGAQEVRVRLARFPDREEGALWMSVFVDGRHYAVVDRVALGPSAAATPLADAAVAFAVANPEQIEIESAHRHDRLTGRIRVQAMLHESYHPPTGAGTLPVSVEATFTAAHGNVRPRPGRLEVFGSVAATVTTPTGSFSLQGPGKWHEQSGQRARFAPAFTYMWGHAGDIGLLAQTSGGSTWGYLLERGGVTLVEGFTIEPVAAEPRAFQIRLSDGRVVHGSASALRRSSDPIEGRRRPSATVLISTDAGELAGHLNDWEPADAGG